MAFEQPSKKDLQEVALRLIPHESEIIEDWIRLQFSIWKPPGISRTRLKEIFGELFHDMLACMKTSQLELCIDNLEEAGAYLARQNFPYEALIISLHFLEESYLRFLLDPPSDKTLNWLLSMDEFLHAALAAIATSYFQAQRRELLQEAEAGRIVQEGLLPNIPKKILDLEVASVYLPSGERAKIGGDLIDIFMLDSKQAAFIVGDISGHGLSAATDAVMIRSLFRGFVRENPSLAGSVTRLNRVLNEELEPGHFATAIAGVYDGAGGLKLTNAGHPSPVLCGSRCDMLEIRGIVLAATGDAEYTEHEATLEPGAVFLAYTDGLTEARNPEGFFGEERVVAALSAAQKAPARAIAEHLRDEALRFAGGNLKDDVAILVLKRT